MPSFIDLTDLPAQARECVHTISLRHKVVCVAIDVNFNIGYCALVHNRRVHDPFDLEAYQDMPFYIDLADQQAIIAAIRGQQQNASAAA